jgi:ATP-dependent DNA ligase
MRPEALEERRKRLAAAFPENQGDARRHPNERGTHRHRGAIFRHSCGLGLQGIVSKRTGSG